jgi:hypothetical protein
MAAVVMVVVMSSVITVSISVSPTPGRAVIPGIIESGIESAPTPTPRGAVPGIMPRAIKPGIIPAVITRPPAPAVTHIDVEAYIGSAVGIVRIVVVSIVSVAQV